MKLNKDEVESLVLYFDATTINVTKMIKKMGYQNWSDIEKVIVKLYKEKEDGKTTRSEAE
jgi:hypothetical protein